MFLSLIVIVFSSAATALAVFATNKAEKNLTERHILTKHGRGALVVIALGFVLQSIVAIEKDSSDARKEKDAQASKDNLQAENDSFRNDTFSLSDKLSSSQKLAVDQKKEIDTLSDSIGDCGQGKR